MRESTTCLISASRVLVLLLVANLPTSAAQAQAGPTPEAPVAAHAVSLPADCLSRKGASQPIAELLETLQDHPTAGAYNTLGALFAQQGRDPCAVAAFEASLHLNDQSWEAHYNLAIALIRRGDRSRAAVELRSAIQQKPDSAYAHFALATLLQDEHKTDQAELEFQSALSGAPNFVPASLGLANLLLAQKKYAAAIQCLEKALTLSPPPDQVETLKIALSTSYAQSRDLAKATDLLKTLVAEHPESAQAHFHLGVLYAQNRQQADNGAAIGELEAALRLDPHLNEARLPLATVLIDAGENSAALKVLGEYIHGAPSVARGYYEQGVAYSGLGQWNDAVNSLRHAVRLDPGSYDIRFALGSALAHASATGEAITQFRAAARLNPSAPEVHHQLAILLEKTQPILAEKESAKYKALLATAGNPQQAASWTAKANQALASGNASDAAESYRKALQSDPQNPQLHFNLSLALDRLGDRKGERAELQKAVQLDASLAPAHNQLGLMALEDHHQPEAEKEFKLALQINPVYAEAQNNLGILYNQQEKHSEAAALFQRAIENDPKYSRAYVNLGLTLAMNGDYAGAERNFQSAIRTDPQNAGAYSALGMLQTKTGRGTDATGSFRKAVDLQPGSADAHLNLGIALADQYDAPGAFKEFSDAVRLDPNSAAAHYNLGRYYYQTGKSDDARKELATACRLQPNFPAGLYFLALAEQQNNQIEHSTELLKTLVALEPTNADAQYLLGQNLEQLGETNGAIEHWKLAVEADPKHSQALYNLSHVLAKLHDPTARQYQERFEELQKMQQIADRVQQLGNFALEAANAQNWPQALQQMEEALQLCGQCSEAAHLHKNLGLFYCRTGRTAEGEKELRAALELDPSDRDAQQTLQVLGKMRSVEGK